MAGGWLRKICLAKTVEGKQLDVQIAAARPRGCGDGWQNDVWLGFSSRQSSNRGGVDNGELGKRRDERRPYEASTGHVGP
jgi:hypothetical protein